MVTRVTQLHVVGALKVNILYVAPPIPDFLADSILHGLRSLLGTTVIDVPKAEQMYRNAPPKSFHGRGFTLYKTLHDDIIDRSNIPEKIKSKFFDLIIYGCVSSCYPENEHLHYWDLVKENYPLNKIFLIDGADPTDVKDHLVGAGVYFKREIPNDSRWGSNLVPISFSIPREKIYTGDLDKTRLIAPLIPGSALSYIYDDESSYYKMYQESMFALTWKKAGWDCMRHYEIMANGTLPLFLDIENLPRRTMVPFPSAVMRILLDLPGLNTGNFNPSMTFEYDDRNTITNVDFTQFGFDMREWDEYVNLSQQTRQYLYNNLTTLNVAKYLLEKAK